MKKSLLTLSAALLAGLAMSAATPTIVEGVYAAGVSPNGEWGVCTDGIGLILVNLKTGEKTVLEETGLITPGGCISNDGTIVYVSDMDQPFIAINGVVKAFDTTELLDCSIVYLDGISADGKYVVGSFSRSSMYGEEMGGYPAVWEVDPEGNVVKATELPCPTVDFTGRTPQRCDAIAISEDGKTIVGNLIDYRGMMPQPVVYTLGEDGEWTYSMPASSLLNPKGLTFPELAPEPYRPSASDFMTEEEYIAYLTAVDEWWQDMSKPYPEVSDFMTEEEIEKFNEAAAIYNEWTESLFEYLGVYDEIMADSPIFEVNSEILSPDGKMIALSQFNVVTDPDDPWNIYTVYNVLSINLETGAIYSSPEGENYIPNQIIDGERIIALDRPASDQLPQVAYIKDGPDAEFVSLYDYYLEKNPGVAEWLNENFHKSFQLYSWATGDYIDEEGIYTGLTYMSKDGSTQFSGVLSYIWDPVNDYTSYIIQDTMTGIGMVNVGNTELTVTAAPGGVINIAGDADFVTVYDLTGRVVFRAPAAATVATGLSSAMYIVKVDSANGSKTVKVTF